MIEQSFWTRPVRCVAPWPPPSPPASLAPFTTLSAHAWPLLAAFFSPQDAGRPLANLPRSSIMTFLNHTHSLLVLVWLAFAPVLVVATGLQDQTFGINNSAVLFSTGWSTVSNAAGTFRETTGKANEVEIFLPGALDPFSHLVLREEC